MRLLTVDWDYFFPVHITPRFKDWMFYDWSHSESQGPMLDNIVWTSRAANFIANGIPVPQTSGEEKTFWDRFKIKSRAPIFISDSHMYALANDIFRKYITDVWLYDAHHDCGYGVTTKEILDIGSFDCSNWMMAYATSGARLSVRYPTWKEDVFDIEPTPDFKVDRQFDDGKPNDLMFDVVHICRSGSWTPPWVDAQFDAFVAEIGLRGSHRVKTLGEIRRRDFDMKVAEDYAEKLKVSHDKAWPQK